MREAMLIAASFLAFIALVIGGTLGGRWMDLQESTPPPTPYFQVWEWCEEKFPTNEGQREACRWGAYEMLPGQDVEVGQDA